MFEKIDDRNESVTGNREEITQSLSVAIGSSRNQINSTHEPSPSASQPSTTLSNTSSEHLQSSDSKSSHDVQPQSLEQEIPYQGNIDLVHVGGWSHQGNHAKDQYMFIYGSSMKDCLRHSPEEAKTTGEPQQKLSPYERWVSEDVMSGGVRVIGEGSQSDIVCSCASILDI